MALAPASRCPIVVVGLPAVGKSYTIRHLVSLGYCLHLECDRVRREMDSSSDQLSISPKVFSRILTSPTRLVKYYSWVGNAIASRVRKELEEMLIASGQRIIVEASPFMLPGLALQNCKIILVYVNRDLHVSRVATKLSIDRKLAEGIVDFYVGCLQRYQSKIGDHTLLNLDDLPHYISSTDD